MTVIDSNIALNELLLTYLKARWAAPAMRTVPVPDGFLGWLADRGDSLDHARYEHFKRYRVRDGESGATAFAIFALRNLPLDTEQAAAYVARFAYDQARIGYVVSDAAYQALVTGMAGGVRGTRTPPARVSGGQASSGMTFVANRSMLLRSYAASRK